MGTWHNIVRDFNSNWSFNTEMFMENLCQRVSLTLGQRSFNGQNYAIV